MQTAQAVQRRLLKAHLRGACNVLFPLRGGITPARLTHQALQLVGVKPGHQQSAIGISGTADIAIRHGKHIAIETEPAIVRQPQQLCHLIVKGVVPVRR